MKNVMRYVPRDEEGGDGTDGGAAPPGGGAAAQNWRDGLSEEYRDNPSLRDFADINGLAKAHIDTKAMVGKMVRIPGEDASQADVQAFRDKLLREDLGVIPQPDLTDPEQAAAYYQKMGRPQEAEGYTKPEGMDDQRYADLSKLAFEAGISDKQFAQVATSMVAQANEANKAIVDAREAGVNSLKTEWGEAFPEKYARAQRLAEATKAPQGLIDAMANQAVDAATLKWLDSVAGNLGGEGNNLLDVGNIDADTKAELEAQRDELTRRLQSDERIPQSERQRLIAKNVDLNTRLLALTG